MTSSRNSPELVLSVDDTARLHRMQLQIAKRIKEICDSHAIDYFLISGTLLGAVRHRGFIPWDDDMDIGMPRRCYEQFLSIAAREMGDAYFVQTMQSDRGYGLGFAKVRLNGTRLVEAASARTNGHCGVFVDVFPFDNAPEQRWLRRLHALTTTTLIRLILLRKNYTPWTGSAPVRSLVYEAAARASKILPARPLSTVLEKTMCLFNGKPTHIITAISGSYGYDGESISRSWIDEYVDMAFENTSFKCPVGFHQYLKKLYGEYMVMPPVEKRTSRHGIIALDFGKANGC